MRAYHAATKHHFQRFARGPHELDWATQPDPFRRYGGAPLLALAHVPPGDEPRYEPAFVEGEVPARPLDAPALGQLFYDSLALSAWKRYGEAQWSLRVNPSSGNLHPTEAYLVCGGIEGLHARPCVAHYAPREHALELRAELPDPLWKALARELPTGAFFVGLSSIHWREAWKYGERAFRYCQHDVGHALGALSVACLALGWRARLVETLASSELARLLGIHDQSGPEAEHPDALLLVAPQHDVPRAPELDDVDFSACARLAWRGAPLPLSSGHLEWDAIEAVARATLKPRTRPPEAFAPEPVELPAPSREPISLRAVVRGRRSAVALDGRTGMRAEAFFQALERTVPAPGRLALHAWPWSPRVHLVLFVHRVEGLAPGLYVCVRGAQRSEALRAAARPGFAWQRPAGTPTGLALFMLQEGDLRSLSRAVACHQEIAADGCFSVAMLADFEQPLRELGPWTYPRLFWECGLIGQLLYLEAEALSIRGTGIGCYFDDPVHELLGLRGEAFQDLYHFTLGGPVEDTRLTTLPAYPPRDA